MVAGPGDRGGSWELQGGGFEGCERSVSGLSATLHQYGENRLGLWHAVSYLSSKHVLPLHHDGQYNHTDLAQIVFANLKSVFLKDKPGDFLYFSHCQQIQGEDRNQQ